MLAAVAASNGQVATLNLGPLLSQPLQARLLLQPPGVRLLLSHSLGQGFGTCHSSFFMAWGSGAESPESPDMQGVLGGAAPGILCVCVWGEGAAPQQFFLP